MEKSRISRKAGETLVTAWVGTTTVTAAFSSVISRGPQNMSFDVHAFRRTSPRHFNPIGAIEQPPPFSRISSWYRFRGLNRERKRQGHHYPPAAEEIHPAPPLLATVLSISGKQEMAHGPAGTRYGRTACWTARPWLPFLSISLAGITGPAEAPPAAPLGSRGRPPGQR